MPIYEYHCEKCGKDSELLVRSAEEKPLCPDCGSTQLTKQFSVFAATGKPAGNHVHSSGCGCGHGGCHN